VGAFDIQAGLVAHFAVVVVELEVANNHAIVSTGDELGYGVALEVGHGHRADRIEHELLLVVARLGVADPVAVLAHKVHAQHRLARHRGIGPLVVLEEVDHGGVHRAAVDAVWPEMVIHRSLPSL
jgi:hypothetical protein